MKSFFLCALLCAHALSASATDCQPPNQGNGQPYSMELHGLQWCAEDTGFNEGATCGAQALSGINVGAPAIVAQPILGNTWRRRDMIAAAKTAAKNGFSGQAVAAATCCQVQNGHMHACMSNNPDAVRTWLLNN